MFEYAVIMRRSLAEQVGETFYMFSHWLKEISPFWFVGALILLLLLMRFLRSR